MARVYFFIFGIFGIQSKVVGALGVLFSPLSLVFLVVLLFDLYYLLLSVFMFRAGNMILELDLIYRRDDYKYLNVNN